MRHKYFIERLAAYADKRTEESESLKIKAHLLSCKECSAIFNDMLLAKRFLNVTDQQEIPADVNMAVKEAIAQEKVKQANNPLNLINEKIKVIGELIWSGTVLRKSMAFATVAALAFVGFGLYRIHASQLTSIVVASRGPVQVFSKSKNKWMPAKSGLRISSKDIVQTGQYGQLDIESNKLFEFRIKQNSKVRFERLAKNIYSNTTIAVERGKIMINTNDSFKGSSMKVVTKASCATVIGTSFVVGVNPLQENTTWVGVLKGNVSVVGLGVSDALKDYNKVMVKAGEKTVIRPGEVPTIPEIFSDKEWLAMDELYRIGDIPQVSLLISANPNRVEELMRPCMLYIYDKEPRTLSEEFDKVILQIKKAVDESDMMLHKKNAKRLAVLIKKYPSSKYTTQFYLFLSAYSYYIDDYKSGLNALNTIIDDYNDSSLVSLAICAKAYIYENGLKDINSADILYKKIIAFYPNTPEAEYAAVKLNSRKK